ncbi:MAG: RecQ family ATP-dependent DNA helicase [Verrucomicrobiota bacterium]
MTEFRQQDIAHVLKDLFGFHSFLSNQQEIVEAILARQDAFVVMPTGGGKSLCYQLPAHIMDGTCIVISPLISLMKDQVDAAIATGLRASFLNSSLSASMKRGVERELTDGKLDLIYVSPERFAMPEFIAALKRVKLSFVAIDEAHCVSEWGHDFRPDYLNLGKLTGEFPDVPVTAFTATATHKVQDDIVAKLGLRSPHVVRASFNRPNLYYKVVAKAKPGDQILRFVKSRPGDSGIVYRTTRKSVEQTANMLVRNGIKALPYHAGLEDSTRVRNQEAFNRDEIDVIVGTIAFGMGIDKSNVRYVLHGDLPKNIESYYQETGRSGRDGEPATCLLLFGYGDIPKIRFFIDQLENQDEKMRQLRHLNKMVNYATVNACRRKQLLNYFGEEWPRNSRADFTEAQRRHSISVKPGLLGCPQDPMTRHNPAKNGKAGEPASNFPCCDICEGEVESIDATRDAQIIMSAIARTGERFGINHIVSVVTGSQTAKIQQLGHDRIKTYGAGQDHDKRHWRQIIDNLLAQGLILQTDNEYPVLQLQPESREVLFGNRPVHILKTVRKAAKRRYGSVAAEIGDFNSDLFENLRDLRKKLASEQGVPPYVVFSDRALHEMARYFPTTRSDMLQITGVGETKLARYCNQFMQAITQFQEQNPGAAPLQDSNPSSFESLETFSPVESPGPHEQTWELLRKGMSVATIAARYGKTENTIYRHIERLIQENKPVDIDTFVPPEKRRLIEYLFEQHGSERLKPIVEAAKGQVDYNQTRLVRALVNSNAPHS